MSTPSIPRAHPQVRPQATIPEAKAEVRELAEKVDEVFKLLAQENITETMLSHIHEPRKGWKENFLSAYKADNLVGCAELLEEAIDACVEQAKRLSKRDKALANDMFINTLASLGKNEKTLLVCNSLSKKVEEKTLGPLTKSALAIAPTIALGTYRLISAGIGTGVTSFGIAASKVRGAFSGIPIMAQSAQLLPLIGDVIYKNPWPALAGGVAALGTIAAMYAPLQIFPAVLLGQETPIQTTLSVAASAMELVRTGQWIVRKARLAREERSALDQPFYQVVIGNKEILVETQKIPVKQRTKALKSLSILMKGIKAPKSMGALPKMKKAAKKKSH